ncbi:MAG: hypothetical protein ACT4RN_09230 [Pseudonocardia sp.]
MAGDHTGLDLAGLAPNELPPLVYEDVDSGFEVVRRGYDQRQVDGHLSRIDAEIRILIADRNAALEQATQLGRELDESRARAERLRAQVRTLVNSPTSVPGMSERMRSMLRLAEDEVNDMLTQATTESARRRREAEQEAAEIRSTALAEAERAAAQDARRRADCEAECVAAVEAMAAEHRAATANNEAERSASRARIARADEDARLTVAEERAAWEMRKALVEEDFALAMDQRRARAIAELEAGRTETYRRNADMIATAQEQSKRTVTVAEEYARRTVAEAQRRVAEFTASRERVAAQLAEARSILQEALGTLAARPELDTPDGEHVVAAAPDSAEHDTTPTNGSGPYRPAASEPVEAVPAEEPDQPADAPQPGNVLADAAAVATPGAGPTPDGAAGSARPPNARGANGRAPVKTRWRRPSPTPR